MVPAPSDSRTKSKKRGRCEEKLSQPSKRPIVVDISSDDESGTVVKKEAVHSFFKKPVPRTKIVEKENIETSLNNSKKEEKRGSRGKRNGKIDSKTAEPIVPQLRRPNLLLNHFDHSPCPIFVGCDDDVTCLDVKKEWPELELFQGQLVDGESKQKWTELVFPRTPNDEKLVVEIRDAEEERKRCSELSDLSSIASCSQSTTLWSELINPINIQLWSEESLKHQEEVLCYLKKWKKRLDKEAEVEAQPKNKSKKKKGSKRRYSDDENSGEDSDYSPEDEREHRQMNNPLVLYGGGCGSMKESFISSLASSSGFEILEMHPGEKRDGESVKRKLHGAATSHRIAPSTSVASFFGGSTSSGEKKSRSHTLVLISCVDTIFEADREFISAVVNFLVEARVPVVLTSDIEITRGPLRELSTIHQLCIPLSNRIPNILQTIASSFGNCSISDDSAKEISTFFSNDLHKAVNWLQLACATKGEISLPKIEGCSSSRENGVIGVEWEHVPLAVHLDENERKRNEIQRQRELHMHSQMEQLQHSHPTNRLMELSGVSHSLSYFDGMKSLAVDVVPMLHTIDDNQKKHMERRRAIHYFSRIESNERAIDGDGQLRTLLHQMRNMCSTVDWSTVLEKIGPNNPFSQ